jgi:antitoxin component of MazEF toxin-antitoxin module
MADPVFHAIDSEALLAKSKVYVARALERKQAGDLDLYQLWSSLALELLGKALLARRHPSLIVDPTHWQSMFVAAGINVTTDVKTITAKTLFERLAHLLPRFDREVQHFCKAISERRNAELHSGDLPFRSMRVDLWEPRFWHACETILHGIEITLEDWLGASDAQAPRALLQQAELAQKAAVKLRVESAAKAFKARPKEERTKAHEAAAALVAAEQDALFDAEFDLIWHVDCPACEALGLMAGEMSSEEISENDPDEHGLWETVEREYVGERFRCTACDLRLAGSEIEHAAVDPLYSDFEERELEYEPDYGND